MSKFLNYSVASICCFHCQILGWSNVAIASRFQRFWFATFFKFFEPLKLKINQMVNSLFQGCLNPVKVIIPEGSILDPSEVAAVVGGNVLTSQRIVDVILLAFQACAASQGCCNNITFGDENFGLVTDFLATKNIATIWLRWIGLDYCFWVFLHPIVFFSF